MISEERMKELIKRREMIYSVQGDEIIPYDLAEDEHNVNNYYEVDDDCLCLMKHLNAEEDDCEYAWLLETLFETEEEATEYLKYGNVTRTEKFPYVSWEEIDKDFQNLANGTYTIAEDKYKFSLNIRVNKPFVSQILLVTEETNFNWNYSRENYHKALDLAIRLWKGEE